VRLTDVVLAENALADPQGRLSLYNLITAGLTVPSFPAVLRHLAVVTRWESPMPFRQRVALFAPDGTLLADADAEAPAGPYLQLTLFSDVALPVPGTYRLVIYAGGEEARTVPLEVMQAQEPPGGET